jgi:DNA polymerase V
MSVFSGVIIESMEHIGLVDCNNFFVSCERLFRPDLAKRPVAVLSSNDGCIVARSQEVKDLGIPMGVPYFQVRDMCKKEHVTLFSSNFKLYRDISKRVMKLLGEAFDTLEVYSVDEAFFVPKKSMTEAELFAVRNSILTRVGIPVSIGVAATKTIAKYASTLAKKGSGVCILDEAAWEKERGSVSCGTVWGIGRQTAAKLTADGVHTVEDFLLLDPAYVKKKFGVNGERICMELSGTAAYPVGMRHEPMHQSITSSRSFSKATSSLSDLQNAVGYHVMSLATRLRRDGLVTSHIYVSARPSRHGDFAYRNYSANSILESPTDSTDVLLKRALVLLDTLYDPEVPYKKAGVSLGGIVSKDLVSAQLFPAEGTARGEVDTTVDSINTRYGAGTVRPGVVRNATGLPVSASLRSGEYTTDWSQIRTIKAI